MKEKIRKANVKDSKRVLELLNNDPNLSLDGNKGDYQLEDIKEYIKAKINRSLVYELDGKVVGFITAQFWKTYSYLHLIVIDKEFHGKGIGTQLIKKLEDLAVKQGIDTIESITEIENEKMQGLFNKLNYRKGNKFISFIKNI